MNAYTISSSSSAMSVAREAAGSSTTSAGSLALSSGGMPCLEEVAAHQVARARALHVGSRVDDGVPLAARGRIGDVEGRPGVRRSQAVGDGVEPASPPHAAAHVAIAAIASDVMAHPNAVLHRVPGIPVQVTGGGWDLIPASPPHWLEMVARPGWPGRVGTRT